MSSSSGTTFGYSVEARLMSSTPRVVLGQPFDQRWQRVEGIEGQCGVPACPPYEQGVVIAGLLSYQAAQALRWWFHASANYEFSDGCIETRIVKHKIVYSWSTERISEHCLITGEDRSNRLPAWGGRETPPGNSQEPEDEAAPAREVTP